MEGGKEKEKKKQKINKIIKRIQNLTGKKLNKMTDYMHAVGGIPSLRKKTQKLGETQFVASQRSNRFLFWGMASFLLTCHVAIVLNLYPHSKLKTWSIKKRVSGTERNPLLFGSKIGLQIVVSKSQTRLRMVALCIGRKARNKSSLTGRSSQIEHQYYSQESCLIHANA